MNDRSDSEERELALMALASRKYYLADQNKTQIAEELHLSRFQVARLLEKARRSGVVRIEVGIPGSIDVSLAAELREQFSLRHSMVIDAPESDYYLLLHHLSQATLRLLSRIVTGEDVLGLASARAILGLGAPAVNFARCPIVQLTGAISGPDAADIIYSVRSLARRGGGAPYSYYAPIVAGDEAAQQAYLREPDVARAFTMLPKVTVAVVGIGAWAPGLSTVYDMAEEHARAEASHDGVVVEVAGNLLDENGLPVDTPLARQIVAPSLDRLRHRATVVGAAFDSRRAEAVRTAIRTGWVNGLVTHRGLAGRLLSLPPAT